MGWNISHGSIRRSYTSMHNLGQHLAHVLPARDWRTVAPLFNRGSGDPFTVPAKDAGRMASVLRQAARHRAMPPDWAQDVTLLADSADRAARSRGDWAWS